MSAAGETLGPLADIERLAQAYADEREQLSELIARLEADIAALKRERLGDIKAAVSRTAEAHEALHNEIDARREYFVRPRTRLMHGIRVGLKQKKATVEIEDESVAIERIRKYLPADQAELLIRVTESVHKPAVYDLEEDDLKRLGIGRKPASDVVYIKAQDSAVAKLVDALLEQGDKLETL